MPYIMALCCNCAFAQQAHYRKLNIEEMFELADSNNTSIKLHEIAKQEAEERVRIAKNAYLPSIETSLSLSYNGDGVILNRNFNNSFMVEIPDFGNNFSIEARQIIFSGGAIENSVRLSESQSKISSLNAKQNQQKVRFIIVGNYLDLCKINNQLIVFDLHIQQIEKVLKDMKARFEQGTALSNDITRYELELQNIEYQKTKLQNNKQIINKNLLTILGLDKDIVLEIDETDLKELSNNNLTTTNFSNALPIQLAKQAMHINEHRLKISNSERLPKIALFAFNNLNAPVTIEIPALNKNFNYWGIGIGISYNIDNLYKSNKKIKADKLALQKSLYQISQTEEEIELEIEKAIIQYHEAFDLLQTKEKSLELATKNFQTIEYKYKNDLALISDLLDASTQKLGAELEIVNAKINIVYNFYKMQFILGTL